MTASYWEATDKVDLYVHTVKRWKRRQVPYQMMGGKARDQLVGDDQLLLSIVLCIYHNVSADKICAFVVANGG